jgi:hypothetical protein
MKKQPKKDEIKTVSDDYGNLILICNNGVRLVLYLKLKAETRKRKLGVVNLGQRTIEIKRNYEKHIFRKNESYGFNYSILADAKKFDNVRLKDEKNEWLVPRQFILDNGKFLFFKENGFEKQIFIPISELKPFQKQAKF